MDVDTVHVLTTRGVRISYKVAGSPSAPAMLPLHALGQRGDSWVPVRARFAEQFRVYTLDLRGHGDSDWPGEYSLQLMCDDVIGALDHLGVDSTTLVGHSMGGAISYLIAMQHPKRVQRLVIEDAVPPFRQDVALPQRPRKVLDFDWAVVLSILRERDAGDPAAWRGLGDIAVPTLLVAGGPKSHVPQHRLEDVAGYIPRCRLVTVAAGHNVHANRPAEFVDAILNWIAEN